MGHGYGCPAVQQIAPMSAPSQVQEPINLRAQVSVKLSDVIGTAPAEAAEGWLSRLEIVLDVATIMVAVWSSYALYAFLGIGRRVVYTPAYVWWAGLLFACVFVLLMDRDHAYDCGSSLLSVRETERMIRVSVIAFTLAFALTFVTNVLISRYVVGIAFVLVPAAVALQKCEVRAAMRWLRERGHGVRRVIIYGAGYTGRRMFSLIARSPKLGLQVVGFVDDDARKWGSSVYESSYERRHCATVLRGRITSGLIEKTGANGLIVAIHSLDPHRFTNVASQATAARANLMFVPQTAAFDCPVEYSDLDGMMLASFASARSRTTYDLVKRIFDLGVACCLLALLSPLLGAIALAIRLSSPGPVLFRQKRVGRDGREFRIFKFRSMYADAPAYAESPKDASDTRITLIGRLLRHTSLDELPQLLNVVAGEMSLVGPRPEMPFIVRGYSEQQRRRLAVKPGITGLWQLSGDRAYAIHENIEYDLYYIQHRNFFMDVAILFHTAIFAMRGV